MGDLVLKGATSGQITLTPTGVAGTNTLTLPARTGNIITSADTGTVTQAMLASNVAGNGPAFGVYTGSGFSVSNVTFTSLPLNVADFNIGSQFDTSTYRFTPTIAGYYLLEGNINYSSNAPVVAFLSIFKNGSEWFRGAQSGGTAGMYGFSASGIIYLNGSTDFAEFKTFQASGGTLTGVGGIREYSYCSGSLVRAA